MFERAAVLCFVHRSLGVFCKEVRRPFAGRAGEKSMSHLVFKSFVFRVLSCSEVKAGAK